MEKDIVQRIRLLQKELHEVPLMGIGAPWEWDEQSSPEETAKYLQMLLDLKSEKDRDTSIWRKIVNWD